MVGLDTAVVDETAVDEEWASGSASVESVFGLLVQPAAACDAARRLESQPLPRRRYPVGRPDGHEESPGSEITDRAMDSQLEDGGSPNIYVGTALYWRP
jgi:hypothetical protein